MLSTARRFANRNDFALIAMLGLLGLRIFEATGTDITMRYDRVHKNLDRHPSYIFAAYLASGI